MNTKHILIALIFFAITLSSCRLINSTGGSFLTATVDGEEFVSLNLLTTYTETDSSVVTITGSTGGIKSQNILFTIPVYNGEGVYEFGGNSLNIATYSDGISATDAFTTVSDGTGSINLDVITNTIAEGTFNFTVTGEDENGELKTVVITDGEFGIER